EPHVGQPPRRDELHQPRLVRPVAHHQQHDVRPRRQPLRRLHDHVQARDVPVRPRVHERDLARPDPLRDPRPRTRAVQRAIRPAPPPARPPVCPRGPAPPPPAPPAPPPPPPPRSPPPPPTPSPSAGTGTSPAGPPPPTARRS